MKIYAAAKVIGDEFRAMLQQNGLEAAAPGTVLSDGKTYLAIATADGAISVTELQLAGKKRMGLPHRIPRASDICNYTGNIIKDNRTPCLDKWS